jgi:hypothetical protein
VPEMRTHYFSFGWHSLCFKYSCNLGEIVKTQFFHYAPNQVKSSNNLPSFSFDSDFLFEPSNQSIEYGIFEAVG